MIEKLIELLKPYMNKFPCENESGSCEFVKCEECRGRELAEKLIENGVILPPCKVGDTVWLVFTPKHPANPSDKGKWFMVQDGVQRLLYGAKGISVETWNMGTYAKSRIGDTVFLTREDAEAELEKRRKEA